MAFYAAFRYTLGFDSGLMCWFLLGVLSTQLQMLFYKTSIYARAYLLIFYISLLELKMV